MTNSCPQGAYAGEKAFGIVKCEPCNVICRENMGRHMAANCQRHCPEVYEQLQRAVTTTVTTATSTTSGTSPMIHHIGSASTSVAAALGGDSSHLTILVAVILAVVLALAIVLVVYVFCRRQQAKRRRSNESLGVGTHVDKVRDVEMNGFPTSPAAGALSASSSAPVIRHSDTVPNTSVINICGKSITTTGNNLVGAFKMTGVLPGAGHVNPRAVPAVHESTRPTTAHGASLPPGARAIPRGSSRPAAMPSARSNASTVAVRNPHRRPDQPNGIVPTAGVAFQETADMNDNYVHSSTPLLEETLPKQATEGVHDRPKYLPRPSATK